MPYTRQPTPEEDLQQFPGADLGQPAESIWERQGTCPSSVVMGLRLGISVVRFKARLADRLVLSAFVEFVQQALTLHPGELKQQGAKLLKNACTNDW